MIPYWTWICLIILFITLGAIVMVLHDIFDDE